jgi:hypothetical protein
VGWVSWRLTLAMPRPSLRLRTSSRPCGFPATQPGDQNVPEAQPGATAAEFRMQSVLQHRSGAIRVLMAGLPRVRLI